MTDRQMEILAAKPPGYTGTDEYPLARETYSMMHRVLQADTSLLQMNSLALTRFASFLDEINEPQSIDLYRWIRHNLSLSTIEALYGPANPLAIDNSLIQSVE
jgi:hypothetical protein